MDKQSGSISRVATPLKAWASRFAFLLLVGLAFALMILGRSNLALVERLRSEVTDAIVPILDVAARPIDSVGDAVNSVEELVFLRQENERLRAENERLLDWRSAALHLEGENGRLRDMLNLVPDPSIRYVSARVVGDTGGTFVRSVLVNSGKAKGVIKGQAAITGEGLVGRVAEVGERSARILLITDINSRIPVIVGQFRDRAVLGGDNRDQPRLMYLAPTVHVSVGDRVMTSGHAGVFPPGIPVGVVTKVNETGVRVEPFVDWNHLEFVRVIDYGMPGMLRLDDKVAEEGAGR